MNRVKVKDEPADDGDYPDYDSFGGYNNYENMELKKESMSTGY